MTPVQEFDGKIEAEGELFLYDNFWKKLDQLISESPLFDELIDTLQKPEALDWYDIRDYDLSEARDNERIDNFPSEGDIVLVLSYTGKAEIRFDSPTSDAFDLEELKKIKHTYSVLYLSNEAQADSTIKILFGRGDWNITETRPEIDLEGTIRNDYLEQITDPLKIGQIISDFHILDHADIACEKILLSETTRLDQWRSTEDYTYMAPGRILLHSTTTLEDWRHPSDLTLINGGEIYTHSIEADKLNIVRHIVSGATWADNDPAAGSISWAGAEVTYNGHTYSITDGSTNLAYVWWDLDDENAFQTRNTKPPLTDDDFIVCYNNGGTHELVWNATLIDGRTIRTGSITADEINVPGLDAAGDIVIGDGTITAPKLNVTDLIDIANIMTLAAGRVVINKDAFGADLEGILINDATHNRVEIGELTAGDYGINIRDASGNVTCASGVLASEADKRNLVVKWVSTSTVDVDADLLKLDDIAKVLKSVNLTINIGVSGANGLDAGVEADSTWYSIWVIWNPTTDTTAGLLSTSATDPTMPAGYTKKRRVGWVKNDDDSNFVSFIKIGDWIYYEWYIEVLDTVTPAETWTNLDCSSAIPPTSEIFTMNIRIETDSENFNLLQVRRGGGGAFFEVGSVVGGTNDNRNWTTLTLICSTSQIIEYQTYVDTWVNRLVLTVTGYYDPI